MSDKIIPVTMPIIRQPRLNLAIGPNCPVRCEGCYNNFGETLKRGGIVTAEEVVDFASEVWDRNIDGVTLSGGDPLFHPEITDILFGLSSIGFRIKLDTVGTALLGDSRVVYKGRGAKPQIDVESVKETLESVTLPLDGVNQETIANFRKGRNDLFQETQLIAKLLAKAGVAFGFNTVVNATNIDQVAAIGKLAFDLGAFEWHVFEYDSTGPNPSKRKEDLSISYEQFELATLSLDQLPIDGMRLDLRTRSSRIGSGAYFFINDAGDAWCPGDESDPINYGNISRDREQVMAAYDKYLIDFNSRFC